MLWQQWKRSGLKWFFLVGLVFALAGFRSGSIFAASPQQLSTPVDLVLISPANQPVGTPLLWAAQPQTPTDSLLYQYSVKQPGGNFQVVRGFHTFPFLFYTPMVDGVYEFKLTVRDASSVVAEMTESYQVSSLVTGTSPIVSPTSNPLVALYSAPACATPNRFIRVRFRPLFATVWRYTNWKPCDTAHSNNVYIAGMRADTRHQVQHEIATTSTLVGRGPILPFTTGSLPDLPFPNIVLQDLPDVQTSLLDGVLLQSSVLRPGNADAFPYATDLMGNIIWYHYYPTLNGNPPRGGTLLRPFAGGTMAIAADYLLYEQGFREIDLAGNSVRETNATALSIQLVDMGEDPVVGLHHDAIRLANGHTLLLAYVVRTMEIEGEVIDILGDMILELDEDMQVVWVWNIFDHLTPTAEVKQEPICQGPSSGGGACPPLDRPAYDWTHANALDYIETDGNLLMSIRHLDWVIKIRYANGSGDGAILWRLGPGGDFLLTPNNPILWFSHQHYSHYIAPNKIVIHDNGNDRCTGNPQPCNSRGQVWVVDEQNMTAHPEFNADLAFYAHALGAGGKLFNGNYHFSAAMVPPGISQMAEFLPDGTKVFDMTTDASLYRSFRMVTLYTPAPESALGALSETPQLVDLETEDSITPQLLLEDLIGAPPIEGSGPRQFLPIVPQ